MRLLWDDERPIGAIKAVHIVTATRRFHRHVQRRLDLALRGTGLSYPQYELLDLLRRERWMHGAEFARTLRVSRQTVTHLLHKLSDAGLVQLAPRDYWTREASPTAAGVAALERCREALADVRERVDRVGPEKLEQLLDLLDEVDRTMRRAEWSPEVDDAWKRAVGLS